MRPWQKLKVIGAVAASLFLVFPHSDAQAKSHKVEAGDSLWGLAKRFGLSVEALKSANKLTGDGIRSGQTLVIPPAQTDSSRGTKESKASAAPETKPPQLKAKDVAKSSPATSGGKEAPKRAKAQPVSKKPSGARGAVTSPGADAAKATPAKPPVKGARAEPPPAPSAKAQEQAAKLYSDPWIPRPTSTLDEHAPSWVLAPPGADTQGERRPTAPGTPSPCAAEDPGFGSYKRWEQIAPMAHVLLPEHVDFTDGSGFDLVFHFHGREPIRKEWVSVMEDKVLVSVDVGIDSSSYAKAFSDPRTFHQVLRSVEAVVSKRFDVRGAHVAHLALSAWSAGYAAIEQVLSQPYGEARVDAVLLLDGLHSGYSEHSLDTDRLAPFVRFAKRAAERDTLMFVSHSSIRTTGYASTTETANYLIWRTGGKPQPASRLAADPMGLERISTFSAGNFHVRGFRGSGTQDHCAQLALFSDVLRVHLTPFWAETTSPKLAEPVAAR